MTTQLTCPYCYDVQDPSELMFVCTGQGHPGRKGCDPVDDKARNRETGFSGSAMPVFVAEARRSGADGGVEGRCPHDGSWGHQRACRKCHTPLPVTLVDRPRPLIGMVGDVAVGKTVFLTVLKRELSGAVGDRFDADVQIAGEHQPGLISIDEYLRRFDRALYNDHKLPGRTAPATAGRARVPLLVEWRRTVRTRLGRKKHVSTILPFCDAAGEDRGSAILRRYLRAAGALILLLDPYQLPKVRDHLGPTGLPTEAAEEQPLLDTVVSDVTQYLKSGSGLITTPVAVVLAKFDVFDALLDEHHFLRRESSRPGRYYDDRFGREMHDWVASLLVEYEAKDLVKHFESNYANYRFFAVSSLGALPDYKEKRVNRRGVKPRNVAEPLLWLMSRDGTVDVDDDG